MTSKPHLLTTLDVLTGAAVFSAGVLVFTYAPVEQVMGEVQKIFYFHVALNWAGMLAFLIAAGGGIALLRSGRTVWDEIGPSAVEVGLLFSMAGILTGMLWARPTWNTWWTWDPRLTTVTVMWLVFCAYFILRGAVEDPQRKARFAAIYAILGALSVPLTFFSIRFSRTIHPVVIGSSVPSSYGAFNMTPAMGITLAISLAAFSLLLADLLWHRTRLEHLTRMVEDERGGE
jgi:heme exporter protein C